jgi:hypothetical protein
MFMDKGDLVNPKLFHQQAVIHENYNNRLLEKFTCSQKQDVSACGIETRHNNQPPFGV